MLSKRKEETVIIIATTKGEKMKRTIFVVRHGETDFNSIGRLQGQMNTKLTENGKGQAKLAGIKLSSLVDSETTKKAKKYIHLFSSDLDRAHDTTKIIKNEIVKRRKELSDKASHVVVTEISLNSKIREMNLGTFAGQFSKDIHRAVRESLGSSAEDECDSPYASDSGKVRAASSGASSSMSISSESQYIAKHWIKYQNDVHYKIPQGESSMDFYYRSRDGLFEIIAQCCEHDLAQSKGDSEVESDIVIVTHGGVISNLAHLLLRVPLDENEAGTTEMDGKQDDNSNHPYLNHPPNACIGAIECDFSKLTPELLSCMISSTCTPAQEQKVLSAMKILSWNSTSHLSMM